MPFAAGTARTRANSRRHARDDRAAGRHITGVALPALGIVFGDLGTSPLYTMQTIIGSLEGSPATSALGVLSLIFWTLIITISVKYCLLVMRADNKGEGGILALMSLVGMNDWRRGTYFGATLGLLGAALIYGDGAVTPAISVLSALEGINVATSALRPFVLPLATGILAVLFIAQRFGTATIGRSFGPVMLIWFIVIGLLGLREIVEHPAVLAAADPRHALTLLSTSGSRVLLLLGGVFLCATGGEALYADMGHFGRFPIRVAWYAIVLPSLLLNYAGQTSLLLAGIPQNTNPFFLLAPAWGVVPLVVLATLATIIASQAIITGSFSMTRQAMQLGWLPAFDIRQTSDKVYGQIYVPGINLMMGLATVAITLAFKTSNNLAALYGTAVSTTMVLTTLLLFRAMYRLWRWPALLVIPLAIFLLAVDGGFMVANLTKIIEGGWVPLAIGIVLFVVMVTWRTGIRRLRLALEKMTQPPSEFLPNLDQRAIARVPGTAIFLSRTAEHVPRSIIEYVCKVGALHRFVVALNVHFEEQPRVIGRRCSKQHLADGFWRATLRYGFMEIPDIPLDLESEADHTDTFDSRQAVFFANRDLVKIQGHWFLLRWQLGLFSFLYRNAVRATDRFNLPPDRTVEIQREILL
ncbi:MAG: KUP/HAK/KT family potassium transporter [Alphaproteobacteria bacterium]|nr:KUP/HAK/KT family potassium transporter [Alphaproteobacteria bacterium]